MGITKMVSQTEGLAMQAGYFKTAWKDITQSPDWMAKLACLALVSFIPFFGWIVVFGYFFGWARDIAWKVHTFLPEHVFGNEDGKLYTRGFFILVIGIVFSLFPAALKIVGVLITSVGTMGVGLPGMFWWGYSPFPLSFFLGTFKVFVGAGTFFVSLAAVFFAILFSWAGWMRTSIYGSLSAGFQLKKIWGMLRLDFKGILRIFGMVILANLVLSGVAFVILLVLCVLFFVAYAILMHAVLVAGFLGTVIGVVFLFVAFYCFVLALVMVFCLQFLNVGIVALMSRALGYWTQQFDVPKWRGQDDPMSFEVDTANTPLS